MNSQFQGPLQLLCKSNITFTDVTEWNQSTVKTRLSMPMNEIPTYAAQVAKVMQREWLGERSKDVLKGATYQWLKWHFAEVLGQHSNMKNSIIQPAISCMTPTVLKRWLPTLELNQPLPCALDKRLALLIILTHFDNAAKSNQNRDQMRIHGQHISHFTE